jgi:ribosomal protein S18 acetylase RimI-like enzyme
MTIIRADLNQPDHSQAIVALLNDYARDPMGQSRPLDSDVSSRIIAGLTACDAARVYLAEKGDQFVGVAVCFKTYATFLGAPALNVHDLVVVPAARRQGIGSAMLDAAERDARAEGCAKLTLEVRCDNPAARALYHRHGLTAGTPRYEFWTKCL